MKCRDLVICIRNNEGVILHRYLGINNSNNKTLLILKGDNTDYSEVIMGKNILGVLEESFKSKVMRYFGRDGCV